MLGPLSATAEPRLYTGTLELQISQWDGCTVDASCYNDFGVGYGIPFGANVSYPIANNLPTGDLANLVFRGSEPPDVSLGSNQITLQTALHDSSPPWTSVTFAATRFDGGHAAGRLSEDGAPGTATWTSLPSLPFGHLSVGFSSTPRRFGGTLNLLGTWRARWEALPSGHSFYYTYKLPLTPIGGSFGGSAVTNHTGSVDHTIWGFPWTVGSVWAVAPEPSGFGDYSFPYTYQTGVGTDRRTSMGAGEIQLVSPFVVRHRNLYDSDRDWYQAGIARLTLHFVPEPAGLLLIIPGLIALGALHYRQRSISSPRWKSR